MKSFPLLAAAVVLGLPACDKARDLAGKLRDKAATAQSAATPAPAQPFAGELVSEISEAEFQSFSQQAGRVIVIDFYADWCGPCRRLGPILHDIAAEKQGLVLVGKVNVDRSRALASKHGVQGIPDVRIFRDGKQVDRFVGLPGAAEVRRRIESHVKDLPPLPAQPAAPAAPKSTEPVTQPMSKDWLPPGMQRR